MMVMNLPSCTWLRFVLPIVLLVFVHHDAAAQSFGDYLHELDVGIGADWLTLGSDGDLSNPNHTDVKRTLPGGGFLIGWNFPLVRPSEEIAIGLNPSMNIVYSLPSEGDPMGSLHFPIFVTFKIGADASYYNQSKYGATVGLGWRAGLLTPDSSFGGPAAMAEVATTLKIAIFKLRYTVLLGEAEISNGGNLFHHGLYFVLTGRL
jgi:hypothetical protein